MKNSAESAFGGGGGGVKDGLKNLFMIPLLWFGCDSCQ